MAKLGPYTITPEMQLAELTKRLPPIVNVDIIIKKEHSYLIGIDASNPIPGKRMLHFPGGRMKYTESPQETALRILHEEVPGVKASIKKIISVESDKGWDHRAYGVTIYFLLDYISGEPEATDRIKNLHWIESEEFAEAKNVYALEKQLATQLDIAARSINLSDDELLVEVDKDDNVVGTITKKEAHSTSERYHRASHIMIFTSKGDVVLQQRSWNKSQSPGKWDMPGGHQAEGQTILQCAHQELAEEVGVSTPLLLRKKLLYRKEGKQAEFSYLFYGISDGPYGFDKNEVEQVAVYDCEKLLKEKPEDILGHVFDYIENLRDVWEPLKKLSTE